MPLRVPQPLDVKPSPLSVGSPRNRQDSSGALCELCYSAQAIYTCPTCNAPYCSFACYKDESKHGGCVRSFQSRSHEELRQASNNEKVAQLDNDEDDEAQQEQRRKVLDLLREWQFGGDDIGSDEESFEKGNSGSDTEEAQLPHGPLDMLEEDLPADIDELLAMLSKEERDIFLDSVGDARSLNSPSQALKLWQKILSDEARKRQQASNADAEKSHLSGQTSRAQEPDAKLWWLRGSLNDSAPGKTQYKLGVTALASRRQEIEGRHHGASELGLVWNCLAIFVAYTYILLHLDLRSLEDINDDISTRTLCCDLLLQLLPFLFAGPSDADASLLLDSPGAVTAFTLVRLGEKHRSWRPSQLMSQLYGQVRLLLLPENGPECSVTILDDRTESVQGRLYVALAALGDIWSFLEHSANGLRGQRRRMMKMASHKLVFYGAHLTKVARSGALWRDLLGGTTSAKTRQEGSLQELSNVAGSVRPHATSFRARRLFKEAATLMDEMELLSAEIEASEEDERHHAAWKFECQRLGLGEDGKPQDQGRNRPLILETDQESQGKDADIQASTKSNVAFEAKTGSPPQVKSTTFAEKRRLRLERERRWRI